MASSMTKDLRKKTTEELAELIVKMKEQLLQIRFSVANGEAEKLHTANQIRKTIARALTIINERKAEALSNAQATTKKPTTKGASK